MPMFVVYNEAGWYMAEAKNVDHADNHMINTIKRTVLEMDHPDVPRIVDTYNYLGYVDNRAKLNTRVYTVRIMATTGYLLNEWLDNNDQVLDYAIESIRNFDTDRDNPKLPSK